MQFVADLRNGSSAPSPADKNDTRIGCISLWRIPSRGCLMATHHPGCQALANFLVGDCSPGASLLIAKHVHLCAQCASRVHAMGSCGMDAGPIRFGATEPVAPGLEMALVEGVSGLGEAVYCVRAAPGTTLPLKAVELLVLEGELEADGVAYRAGDYLSLEESPKRQLTSHPAWGCVYLKATHVSEIPPEAAATE